MHTRTQDQWNGSSSLMFVSKVLVINRLLRYSRSLQFIYQNAQSGKSPHKVFQPKLIHVISNYQVEEGIMRTQCSWCTLFSHNALRREDDGDAHSRETLKWVVGKNSCRKIFENKKYYILRKVVNWQRHVSAWRTSDVVHIYHFLLVEKCLKIIMPKTLDFTHETSISFIMYKSSL